MEKRRKKYSFGLQKIYLTAATLLISAFLIPATSCSNAKKRNADSDSLSLQDSQLSLHADNDIAMTIRSIVDAINMGEELDSAFYSYEGVLTDGQGKPLYTDMEGAPGLWSVNVTGPQNVSIRNIRPGDLLPEQLCAYIAESIGLTDDDLITTRSYKDKKPAPHTNVKVYDFGKGIIHFENRMEATASGSESPVLSILISEETDTI